MSLIQDPAGTGRKRATKIAVTGLENPEPEHNWVKLEKKQYCQICKVDKERQSQQEPLSEITNLSNK